MNIRALGAAAVLFITVEARAAELVIQNNSSPGVGFNDPTPATPVGLNFGTTRGEQELIVFQMTAAIWGATLNSSVPITFNSAFVSGAEDPNFVCGSGGVVLAETAPTYIFRSPNFPQTQLWYPVALADSLYGSPLNPGTADIHTRFNADLGTPACSFNLSWYVGLDTAATPNSTNLFTTALHEFSHGLGYISLVDPTTGSTSYLGIFDLYVIDEDAGVTWVNDTASQRLTAATAYQGLAFGGPAVTADIPRFLGYGPAIAVDGGVSATIEALPGQFSGPLTGAGPLVVANPLNACYDLVNATEVAGKVALIQRGGTDASDAGCVFLAKAERALDAGAIGVVIFDNVASPGRMVMGGAPALGIPAVLISERDGVSLQQASAGGVKVTFGATATSLSNTDSTQTRELLYTPSQVRVGSSVSHWNVGSFPDPLLLEPNYAPNTRLNLDLTPAVMADMGWTVVEGLTVGVVKALEPSVTVGAAAKFLIAVINRRRTTVDGVSLNLASPPGTTFVGNQGACTGSFPCALGTLQSGDVRLVVTTLHLPTNASDPFAVTATLTPSSSDVADNLSATVTPPVASGGDLQVSISGPSALFSGTIATFTTTVTNAGPGTATGVSLAGTIAASDGTPLTLSNAGACTTVFPCALGTMSNGGSATVTSTFTVPAGFNAGATVTVAVSSSTPDPNPNNNTASATASVSASDAGTGSGGKGGCSATGEPATALAFIALAVALGLWRRGNPT